MFKTSKNGVNIVSIKIFHKQTTSNKTTQNKELFDRYFNNTYTDGLGNGFIDYRRPYIYKCISSFPL